MKKQFDNLTEIDCPFGMLDKDTQARLERCVDVQKFNGSDWVSTLPVFYPERTYRKKPLPKTVTVYLYKSGGDIIADTEAPRDYYPSGKLIATREIVLEEDEE